MVVGTEMAALLGRGTEFDGTLAFEGTVRIDGALRGRVQSPGTLVLGEGAELEAEIHVGTLIVLAGTLRGNVFAQDLVEIHAAGTVFGDITAPVVDIDKGSRFEGQVSMRPPPPGAQAVQLPLAPALNADEEE
jgi:cytoskeletal protein CcmA (bactofilin family)